MNVALVFDMAIESPHNPLIKRTASVSVPRGDAAGEQSGNSARHTVPLTVWQRKPWELHSIVEHFQAV